MDGNESRIDVYSKTSGWRPSKSMTLYHALGLVIRKFKGAGEELCKNQCIVVTLIKVNS